MQAHKTAKPVEKEQVSAIALLTEDHKQLKKLFKEFEDLKESGGSKKDKGEIVRKTCDLLTIHAMIEEEIFYPAARRAIDDKDLMDEADVEHAGAKRLVSQLEAMSPGDDHYDATFTVLAEQVRHHIREEEGDMFAKIKKSKLDDATLGRKMQRMREELMRDMGLEAEVFLALYGEAERKTGMRAL